MELLVVTLAHIIAGRDADILARIHQITDTVKNAPGMVAAHMYRGREQDSYYFMLTTWEDTESWQKAQKDYDPRQHLLATADLLLCPPEQWLMHYQWGYNRPAKYPMVSAAHITMLPPDQARRAQHEWITGLRQQTRKPTLAFAFLAQEIDRDATTQLHAVKSQRAEIRTAGNFIHDQGTSLLTFLSWASETEREEFYMDLHYQSIRKRLDNLAVTRILPLEQI